MKRWYFPLNVIFFKGLWLKIFVLNSYRHLFCIYHCGY